MTSTGYARPGGCQEATEGIEIIHDGEGKYPFRTQRMLDKNTLSYLPILLPSILFGK